ncbi:MAG: M1 family metallopeptidase [Chloroflexi bacterium]|nr:M1 family metallopeptidase [Chloroflexota bacterium]
MKKIPSFALLAIFLTACSSLFTPSPTPTPTRTPFPSPTPTLTPEPTPTPLFGGLLLDQGIPLIPESREDLASLSTVPRYLLNVDVDWDSLSFQGEEKIWLVNNEDLALDEIYIRLYPNGHRIYGNGSLTVRGVRVSGQEQNFEEEVEGSALRVALQQPLEIGEAIEIELSFEGQVPQDPDAYGIYNFTQGIMVLADWYPILAVYDQEGWNLDPVYGWGDAVYSDVALYQVTVTVPQNLEVIATGSLAQTEEQAGKTSYTFLSGPAREFTMVLSNALQTASREVGETTVYSHFLTTDSAAGQVALEHVAASLAFFNDHFGVYPYRELDILIVPMEGAGGMEYPGLILIDEEAATARVIAHEAAHQWWYGVVGNDVLEEPWVDEALATFSSLLYLEEALGRAAYNEGLAVYRFRYEDASDLDPGHLITDPVSAFPGGAGYFGFVYGQGALFYNELRRLIGDEPLYTALQNYYTDFKYGIATGDDLLAYLEDYSNRELDALYEEWLFTPGAE